MSFKALFFILLLLSISSSFAGVNSKLAIWSEFLPYSEVEKQLPEFKEKNLSLFLAISENQDSDPLRSSIGTWDDFFALYKKAQDLGVEIRPWLLLDQEHDYWFNKRNFPEAQSLVFKFIDEMKKHQLNPEWLIFDMESPKGLMAETENLISKNHYIKALNEFKEFSKTGSVKEAIKNYAQLVEMLHSQNIKVHAVTTHFILNDLADDKLRIQSAWGIPISGINWDEISFMLYRAEFMKERKSIGAHIVYEYAMRARRYFGDRASIDLGEVGQVTYPTPFTGYLDQKELQADLEAVDAAGISNIHIYSLDGMQKEGLNYWLKPFEAKQPKADFWSKSFVFAFDIFRGFLPPAK